MTSMLFELTFLVAAPFWALMILAPGWSWTRRIIASPLIVLPPVLIYAALVVPALGDVLPAVASPTLDGVRELLGTPDGAAAGWAHMIAFDLFVGRWSWLDARDRRIPALIMAPVLLLTILLGPLGLLTYLLIRTRWPRPDETAPEASRAAMPEESRAATPDESRAATPNQSRAAMPKQSRAATPGQAPTTTGEATPARETPAASPESAPGF